MLSEKPVKDGAMPLLEGGVGRSLLLALDARLRRWARK